MRKSIVPFILIALSACSTAPKSLPAALILPLGSEERALSIPVKNESVSYHLNSIFLKMDQSSRPPLIILSHGSPIDPNDRPQVQASSFVGHANEFLKMGFAVLILERRGFGSSKELYAETVGSCDHRDNRESGEAAASDLLGAVRYARENLRIDPDRIFLIGVSAGGFASLFAGSKNPPGVKGIVSFAGGRGAKGHNELCSEQNLIDTFAYLGETSRIPSLWIYSENDQEFSPDIARALHQSFIAAGGKNAELEIVPPFGKDGHRLFSLRGISRWQPLVEDFIFSQLKGLKK